MWSDQLKQITFVEQRTPTDVGSLAQLGFMRRDNRPFLFLNRVAGHDPYVGHAGVREREMKYEWKKASLFTWL